MARPCTTQFALAPHIGHVFLVAPSAARDRWTLADRRTQERVASSKHYVAVIVVVVSRRRRRT